MRQLLESSKPLQKMPMEEQVTVPELPVEDAGQETVELIEAPVDLTPIVDGLAKLQQTADAQLALLAILCGLVLGGVLAVVMQRMWRQ